MGGAGGGSLGIGENLNITIDILSNFDASGFEEAKTAMDGTTQSLGGLATGTEQVINADKEKTKGVREQSTAHKEGKSASDMAANSIRESIAPIRSVSWDLMLMGRSLSILNSIWGNHNVIVKEITGIVYGVGAAIRIAVTAADLYAVALRFGIIHTTAQTASNAALGTSNLALAGTYTVLANAARTAYAAIGPIGWAMLAIGAVMGIGFAVKGSLQGGGTVSETGAYILHKGETVVPAETYVPHKGETVVSSGPSTNIINITMNSGPISSSVDVDNMLDNMALRMAQESRRRIGR